MLEDEIEPENSVTADEIRNRGIIVPQIFHFEIRNALLVAERRGRISERDAIGRLSDLQLLAIETDYEPDLGRTFVLARSHALSFYDALYLELSIRRGSALATLDSALAHAAEGEGISVVA